MSSNIKRCLVAICHNGPVVYRQTAQSLMELGWGSRVEDAKTAHGFTEISFTWQFNWPRVDALRDSAVMLAKAHAFDTLLFLDADQVWPTDTLIKMLRHGDRDIVGGLYVMRHPPYAPVALINGRTPEGSSVTEYEWNANIGTDLVDVDVLGMGCTVIPMSVFEAIGERPWFEYALDNDGWPRVTEDVTFCQRAKKAGYRVALDPTVKCGHCDVTIYDERHYRRYLQSTAYAESKMTVTVTTTTDDSPTGSAA